MCRSAMKLYQNALHAASGASDAVDTNQYQYGLLQTRIPTSRVVAEFSNLVSKHM